MTPDSGNTATVSSVIEIGYGDTKLIFDKAVRIKITGQAGKYVGYSRSGVFTPITNVCSADSQAAGDTLSPEGDCKISIGSDLIIWTKHFTNFMTYTQTAIPPVVVVTTGGGGGGGGGYSYTPPVTSTSTLSATAQKVDTNKDNKVDVLDFVTLMAGWGKTGSGISADFNGDSRVDVLDFVMLMVNWG